METEAEKTQETEGELDDQFIVLAEDKEGFALVQFESKLNTLIYTGRRSQQGRWYKSSIPRHVFFDLAKKAEERREDPEPRRDGGTNRLSG